MKKILTLFIICSTCCIAMSQSSKDITTALEWSNGITHDFGKIMQHQPASYTFEFTNTGTQPVTITKAQPGCSCTVSDYTKEPVLPGKKGLVKATYNAHSAGMFNKTITVSTAPGNESTILKITGVVVQKQTDVADTVAAPRK
ncbi:MAG: DUF1573 domain-containing protein [Chitinophagaceae bacterium]|nr:DUF1573 domain-containing protein [Chitinophagaceae bacterium]